MLELQHINENGLEDSGLELLRQVAQKYCPEEWQEVRKAVIPDEVLDLSALNVPFETTLSHPIEQPRNPILPQDNGFGVGIPETEKLRSLHYDEIDTLNSEEIKRTFPYYSKR